MTRVLGISGKRFSGKDTFAALLVTKTKELTGLDLRTYAFAGESKALFAAKMQADGINVDAARLSNDRGYKEQWRPQLTDFTVRSIESDPEIFCRAVADRIAERKDEPFALITDVRLRLELTHLRPRFDVHLIRLTRSDEARRASGWAASPSVDGHPTETELDDPSLWDEEISNNGSLDELATHAERIVRRVAAAAAAAAATVPLVKTVG